MSVLSLRGISVSYGSVEAVRDLSFSVDSGEMIALLGANGAGKTSIVEAIAGRLSHKGDVCGPDGTSVSKLSTAARAEKGIAVVPQSRELFLGLSVHENLKLGAAMLGRNRVGPACTAAFEQFPKLWSIRDRRAGYLSGGEQQMLALARAVVREPRVLVLDEPSFGLSPSMRETVFGLLDQLQRDNHLATVVAEQFPELVLTIADRAILLQRGSISWEGHAKDVNRVALRQAYFGDESTRPDGEEVAG